MHRRTRSYHKSKLYGEYAQKWRPLKKPEDVCFSRKVRFFDLWNDSVFLVVLHLLDPASFSIYHHTLWIIKLAIFSAI